MSADDLAARAAGDVRLEGPEPLFEGYRRLEGWTATLPAEPGREPVVQRREVLRAGRCVGVIAVDPARRALVLVRQYRVPAALATGEGDLAEIVAGRVEPGEDLETAARRELMEEAGLEALALEPLFSFLPTPGILDEHATMFLATVESGALPASAGAANEHEVTRPFAVPLDEALASITDTRPKNAYLLLALCWLALNPERVASPVAS